MYGQDDRARALLVLGLDPDASVADVEAAYRRLVRRYHPDRTGTTGSSEQLAAVVEARRILQSPAPASPRAPEPPPATSPVPPRRRRPGTRADGPPIVAGPVRYTPAPGKGA